MFLTLPRSISSLISMIFIQNQSILIDIYQYKDIYFKTKIINQYCG
ncbi:hypothetical protein [Campylobacter lanienae]|nr:hypothetical protein [Campylobacter lanienae]MDY6135169.1 hypothetical protein [Campylobacter lanienae]